MEGGYEALSNTIDERILSMQFDNKQFESGIQQSLSSLERLKQSLNLSGAAKGFDEIDRSVRNVDMSGLKNALESVSVKFSALQTIGVTALANITNSAVNAGKRLVSEFTVAPIKSGFQEYETQINAVQTILANTQNVTKKVSQQAIQEVNDSAEAAVASMKELNETSVENLKKSHKAQLKEYDKLAKDELEVLSDKYDDEVELLEDSIDKENELIEQSHKLKLEVYEEEYLAKVKAMDEERYNRLKAVEDEINAINELTEAEEKARKEEQNEKKRAELQNAVDEAETSEERKKAREKLAEFEEDLEREQILAEREASIEALKEQKDAIKDEYEAAEEALKAEYELQKEQEQELYDLQKKQAAEEQKERKELLRDTYETERDYIKDRQETERDAMVENQSLELKYLEESNKAALANIETQRQATLAALDQEAKSQVSSSSLEEINAALDELNKYADKTIYNFTEMTRNIGTFTAAGVDLDTSVAAIKGISNLAAMSGSTSQQASNAMYQLSQALATGTVKLQDWISVGNAGMETEAFKQSIMETARVHGVAIDEIIMKNGTFRNSLQEGWLSSDILLETLQKFTGDLTEAELRSIGYTEEQITGILELGKRANAAATEVKTFTGLMDTLKESAGSGWAQSWKIIIGDFYEAKTI